MGGNEVANRRFISDLVDLTKVGLAGSRSRSESAQPNPPRLVLFKVPVSETKLSHVTRSLARNLYPCLRKVYASIPPRSISDMRKNYTEQLPKTIRFRTTYFASRTSKTRRVAAYLGITKILESEELKSVAERATGLRLTLTEGRQVICYEAGDFCGPHNDHHPEQIRFRKGYVEVHIMLSEPTVMSQLLIYEKERGLLNAVEEVGCGLAIAVYRLPFWHYTTPLIPRNGARHSRRWLFVVTYIIERASNKKG